MACEWGKTNNAKNDQLYCILTTVSGIIEESCNTIIENEINVTVIFLDSKMPTNLNGGFQSQEEFRNYILKQHQDRNWDALIHL